MIMKVKCVIEGCEFKDRIIPTAVLFLNRIAPLDGPFPCPGCGEPMKVVQSVPTNYKGSGAKTMSRTKASRPTVKRAVGRKKVAKKGTRLKLGGITLGSPFKNPTKKVGKKPGPRKRGPSKS